MKYIRPTSNCEKADLSTYIVFEMEISQAGEEWGWEGVSLQTGPQPEQHETGKKRENQEKRVVNHGSSE